MDFAYATPQLRKICQSRNNAIAVLGSEAANAFHTLIADIEAADSIKDLPPDIYEAKSNGAISFKFHTGRYLTAIANHVRMPLKENGEVDWSVVSKLKLDCLKGA